MPATAVERQHVAKRIIRLRPHASLNASPDVRSSYTTASREQKRLVPDLPPLAPTWVDPPAGHRLSG